MHLLHVFGYFVLWENTVLVQGRRCQSGWEEIFHRKRHRGGSELGVYLDIPVIFFIFLPLVRAWVSLQLWTEPMAERDGRM